MVLGCPWLVCIPYRPPGAPFSLSGADAAVLQLIQPSMYACGSYPHIAFVVLGVVGFFLLRFLRRR